MWLMTLFVFLSGVATALSPALLSVLPAVLAKTTVIEEKRQPYGIILGLILSFVAFSLLLNALIEQIGLSNSLYHYTAVLLLGFLGFVFLLPTLNVLFARTIRRLARGINAAEIKLKWRPEFGIGLVYGAMIGWVWASIMGFILIALSRLVSPFPTFMQVAWLAFIYSLGAAIPLAILITREENLLEAFPSLAIYADRARQGMGLGLILIASIFAFNWDPPFEKRMLNNSPEIQTENRAWINQKLEPFRSAPPDFPNQDNNPFSRISVSPGPDHSLLPAVDLQLGYSQPRSFSKQMTLYPREMIDYQAMDDVEKDRIGLKGKWTMESVYLLSNSNHSQLKLRFNANQIYALMEGAGSQPLRIFLDGQKLDPKFYTKEMNLEGIIHVQEKRFYHLVNLRGERGEHELVLTLPEGIKIYQIRLQDTNE